MAGIHASQYIDVGVLRQDLGAHLLGKFNFPVRPLRKQRVDERPAAAPQCVVFVISGRIGASPVDQPADHCVLGEFLGREAEDVWCHGYARVLVVCGRPPYHPPASVLGGSESHERCLVRDRAASSECRRPHGGEEPFRAAHVDRAAERHVVDSDSRHAPALAPVPATHPFRRPPISRSSASSSTAKGARGPSSAAGIRHGRRRRPRWTPCRHDPSPPAPVYS